MTFESKYQLSTLILKANIELLAINYYSTSRKGPVKLIKRVKIAHSFLQSVSNQFHVIILSLPM